MTEPHSMSTILDEGTGEVNPSTDDGGVSRRGGKSDTAFRTISEVSSELGVPQHVLRFWETKFSQIRPMKRGGGRRYYRPEDVVLLGAIRDLLYTDGYTIKGAQKLLRENGIKAVIAMGAESTADLGSSAQPAPQTAPAEPTTEPLADRQAVADGHEDHGADLIGVMGDITADPASVNDVDESFVSFGQDDGFEDETLLDEGHDPLLDPEPLDSAPLFEPPGAQSRPVAAAPPVADQDSVSATGAPSGGGDDPLALARARVDARLSFDQRRECEGVLSELLDIRRILSQAGLD